MVFTLYTLHQQTLLRDLLVGNDMQYVIPLPIDSAESPGAFDIISGKPPLANLDRHSPKGGHKMRIIYTRWLELFRGGATTTAALGPSVVLLN